MPQLSKGGKFIYGKSIIQEGFVIQIPLPAIKEYSLTSEGKVYLFTGSKTTGGFGVIRKGLLLPSKIGSLLQKNPTLLNYELEKGTFIPYKSRYYCWLQITADGKITLPIHTASFLQLSEGMELLSIRGSDLALIMGAIGPILEKAKNYPGVLETF